jgi:hypothetical protein
VHRSLWQKYMWRLDFIDEFTSNLHDAEEVRHLIHELRQKCISANHIDEDDDDFEYGVSDLESSETGENHN